MNNIEKQVERAHWDIALDFLKNLKMFIRRGRESP